MKIINLFKKVTTVTDEKDAHITNIQNSDRALLQKVEHENSNISPNQPITGIDNRWKSDNSTQFANRNTIIWPKTNETVKELMVSQQIRVFFGCSIYKKPSIFKVGRSKACE